LRAKEGLNNTKKAFYVDYEKNNNFRVIFYEDGKQVRKMFRYDENNKLEVEMRVREFIDSKN